MKHRTSLGVATASSSDTRAVHAHRLALLWRGNSLFWRMVRFGVAFALIIVASYVFGGIAGRWL